MPTFLGFPAYLASRFYRKPVFLVVVGENYSFNTFSDYSRIKKWIAGTVARIQDSLMKKMIRHSLTFTNGKDLFEKYKPLNDHTYLMRSSTISAADILPGYRSTCNKKPYKILTVAIVAPRKGTSLIPAIISILKQKGIDVTWTHIGNIDGNAGEQELQKTMKLAADLGVSSQINFHEAIGFDELMPVYRSSDMFVLPTYMEGIPRVILEAQASGLPVITTSVGGIPQVVKQGVDGLLTSPGDSQAMAEAIRQIIQNSNLRQKLIRNGLQTARELTLESETRRMVEKVNDYYYSTHEL
jgi:glycosyltransferase involved in cell wall biosynthesis